MYSSTFHTLFSFKFVNEFIYFENNVKIWNFYSSPGANVR